MLEVQEIRDHKIPKKKKGGGGSIPRQCNRSEPRVKIGYLYIIDLL